jgi:alkaline phosphatase
MNTIPKNFYKNQKEYSVYKPTYETDGVNKSKKCNSSYS